MFIRGYTSKPEMLPQTGAEDTVPLALLTLAAVGLLVIGGAVAQRVRLR